MTCACRWTNCCFGPEAAVRSQRSEFSGADTRVADEADPGVVIVNVDCPK